MTVAITSAIAMPTGMSLPLWDAVVVFGLGAALVAFLVHLLALRLSKASPLVALLVFGAVVVACVASTGALTYSLNFITAAVVGALGASLVSGKIPNSSFWPTSLRDAAQLMR